MWKILKATGRSFYFIQTRRHVWYKLNAARHHKHAIPITKRCVGRLLPW